MVKVAVLGAGVNGLSSALKIKEKYNHFVVLLISSQFTPNTTGDGSGGLWYPYLCGKTPEHLLTKWGGETYNFLHKLWLEGGLNVSVMPMYDLYRLTTNSPRPDWAKVVFGYQELENKQLDYFSQLYSAKYAAGHTFMTFIVPPAHLLGYLYQRFKDVGGEIVHDDVTSLQDPMLDEFDVVINCVGMSARHIVPDRKVYPIRGQICKVIAPWLNATIVDEDGGNYIIPNAFTCVLGGTHQEHNYNVNVDEKDKRFILDGCKKLAPGLKYAEVVNHWVGLRPGRDEIRLETETINNKLFIHNYGHGGSGLTLFWGCASEVLDLLERNLNKNTLNEKSKL